MRHFTFLLTGLLATFLLHTARADQNPAPTSVGLSNFSTFTVGTGTMNNILPRNTARAGLIIQNNGSVGAVIKPGSVPLNSSDGIVLGAASVIQLNPPWVDAIYGQSVSGTTKLIMIEMAK